MDPHSTKAAQSKLSPDAPLPQPTLPSMADDDHEFMTASSPLAHNMHPFSSMIGSRLSAVESIELESTAFAKQQNASSHLSAQPTAHSPHLSSNHVITPTHTSRLHDRMEQVPVSRRKTLTRPERREREHHHNSDSLPFTNPVTNLDSEPPLTDAFFRSLSFSRSKSVKKPKDDIERTPWVYVSWILTCCFPSFFISGCLGKKDKLVQQAFREKVALCMIIAVMMGMVGFLTFGFQNIACPKTSEKTQFLPYRDLSSNSNSIAIHGFVWAISNKRHPDIGTIPSASLDRIFQSSKGADVGRMFPPPRGAGACAGLDGGRYPLFSCAGSAVSSGNSVWPDKGIIDAITNKTESSSRLLGCHPGVSPGKSGVLQLEGSLVFGYNDVQDAIATRNKKYMIYGGHVLDVSPFFGADREEQFALGRAVNEIVTKNVGRDASRAFAVAGLQQEGQCLIDYLKIAGVDAITPACFASTVFVWVSLMIILFVVLAKFVLALYFTYAIGWRLGNNRAYQRAMDDLRRRKDEFSLSKRPTITGPSNAHPPPPAPPSRQDLLPPISGSVSDDGSGSDTSSTHLPFQSQYSFQSASPQRIGERNQSRNESRRMAAQRRENSRDLLDVSRSWNANFGFMDIEAPELDEETMKILDDPTLMHCIAMVPCYSEGRESLKATLDSVANSYYPSTHKVLFVIADGIVRGSDNTQSTPDILIDMIEVDERFRKDDPKWGGDPEAFSYVAIADGANRKNFAKVYAGWYKYEEQEANTKRSNFMKRSSSSTSLANHDNAGGAYAKTMKQRKEGRVPMLLIVKCGNEEERDPLKPASKPGNRGKRDSQVILMNFLCKVMFDDRMTELEFDIFFKLFTITGVNPEKYECVLMVDADTRIYPDSLSHMVACLIRDDRVMGLCGETKILNKWDSWVTMIQVFEYFISHHLSKAFESVFGGCTCLPGCFSMYRIKSPKGPNGYWVPILANPDVVEEYSEHIVDTLHKKNLLLLGEDRFLSTMMLRQFPKRRMVFVPPALCKTVVPDSFKVLLSQRRRWINSTIHNLMELLLVKDLCGTFCISMQFIIFMDLVGTVVLPAAIAFTITILVLSITQTGADTTLPLILLALILGLPAVLILITANRPIYIFWMLVYLLSLPVWNFVLPLYAFWHFDDFSWGATRKVSGEDVKHDHSARTGEFDGKGINMKRWSEWVQVIRAEHERQMTRGGVPFVPYAGGGSASDRAAATDASVLQWREGAVVATGPVRMWNMPPGPGIGAQPSGSYGLYGGGHGVVPMSGEVGVPPGLPSLGIMPPPGMPSYGVIPSGYRGSPLRAQVDDVVAESLGDGKEE
ncbi:Chitin synthase, class 3 [Chytriomyces hyalinus]|nr:Chitin synthase, class 3 [Chytriomyces hyalinus]